MKIHAGDTVLIISGKDKGRTGQVLRLLHDKNRLVVAGINMRTKHIRKTPQRAGQRIQYEASIAAGNVMILDPKTKKPTRIGYRFENGRKIRIAKVSGEALVKERGEKRPLAELKADKGQEAKRKGQAEKSEEQGETKEKKEVQAMPVKKPFWQRLGFGSDVSEEEAHEKARSESDRTIPDQGQGATARSYQRGG